MIDHRLKIKTQSCSGFSLVEMMVIVGIASVLLLIGWPSFVSQVDKSRRAAARAELASLYSAEKTYLAEWNQFFADFVNIGYRPEGKLDFDVGFSAAGPVTNSNFFPNPPPAVTIGNTNPGPVVMTGPGGTATMFSTRFYCPGVSGNSCQIDAARAGNIASDDPGATVATQYKFTAAASRICSNGILDLLEITEQGNSNVIISCR